MSDKIVVIGAGTMGAGIAQIALESGFQVILIDTEQSLVERAIGNIRKLLGKKVEKGKLTQAQFDDIFIRLTRGTDLKKAVGGAVMIVEAVFEKLELKKGILQVLDALCPSEVILASNTSTLSITSLASVTKNPARVIGTHYFSPVPAMRLVEVIRGRETSDETANKTIELCKKLGKTPIVVQDIPGFIVNRFLCLIYNEAADMINRGDAGAEDIDQAMKLGCNWPMGITEIMDLAGVDVCANAIGAMYQMTGEERYKPSPLFERMIAEKKLGRKTGQGFYKYNGK